MLISHLNWEKSWTKKPIEPSKGYVSLSEQDNGGMTEVESRDVIFLENDFLDSKKVYRREWEFDL